jgi:hypothetical protein
MTVKKLVTNPASRVPFKITENSRGSPFNFAKNYSFTLLQISKHINGFDDGRLAEIISLCPVLSM